MREVRHSVSVRCPAHHAFAVFTERVDLWWPPTHRRLRGSQLDLEPGPGGLLTERGPDGTVLEIGQVTAWEPPERVGFAWRLGAPADAPTDVRVTFCEDATGTTTVEVLHREGPRPLPDWHGTAGTFSRAWSHLFTSYAALLEQP